MTRFSKYSIIMALTLLALPMLTGAKGNGCNDPVLIGGDDGGSAGGVPTAGAGGSGSDVDAGVSFPAAGAGGSGSDVDGGASFPASGAGGSGSDEGGGDSHPGEFHCAPQDGVDPDLYCTLGTEICVIEASAQWPFFNHCVPIPDACSPSPDGTCDCVDGFSFSAVDGSDVDCGVLFVECRQDVNAMTVTCDG
ncbi:hypothetical protein [Sorangium sp. So ce341]|uniref:hypothetical protein n=1 Tax=Sorangium sp. So ce341 TaxID=3133302 RepID=UPI003F60B90A